MEAKARRNLRLRERYRKDATFRETELRRSTAHRKKSPSLKAFKSRVLRFLVRQREGTRKYAKCSKVEFNAVNDAMYIIMLYGNSIMRGRADSVQTLFPPQYRIHCPFSRDDFKGFVERTRNTEIRDKPKDLIDDSYKLVAYAVNNLVSDPSFSVQWFIDQRRKHGPDGETILNFTEGTKVLSCRVPPPPASSVEKLGFSSEETYFVTKVFPTACSSAKATAFFSFLIKQQKLAEEMYNKPWWADPCPFPSLPTKTEKSGENSSEPFAQSLSHIQGRRVELHLEDTDKHSSFCYREFSRHCLPTEYRLVTKNGTSTNGLDMLISFTNKQIRRDPLSEGVSSISNHTLIVSLGGCGAQTPHLDVGDNNLQYVLNLTKNHPKPTLLYPDRNPITTFEQMKNKWDAISVSVGGRRMSNSLRDRLEAIVASEDVSIEQYGSILRTGSELEDAEAEYANLPNHPGTLLKLSPGVVHAGPEHGQAGGIPRVVLFCTAHDGQGRAYNNDVQHYGATYCERVINEVILDKGAARADVEYCLRVFANYVLDSKVSILDTLANYYWDTHPVYKFVMELEEQKLGGTCCVKQSVEKCLRKLTKNKHI